MSEQPKRTCIFCLKPIAERSREHVFPQWLLDHLQIREAAISPTHYKPDGTVVSKREHTLENLQEGRVCKTCNEGWMSTLENEAKPLLVHLFSGEKTVVELTSDERKTVARWAAKTAFALNSASNYLKNVPAEHFAAIREGFPSRIMIFGQQHHGNMPFNWLQTSAWHLVAPDHETDRQAPDESYKITLLFGKLLLLVAHWPLGDWIYGIWPGIHVPLWPQSGRIVGVEPETKEFPWNDSQEATAAFHFSLAMLHQRAPELLSRKDSLKQRKKDLAAKIRRRK
jgi:hypothetical protein